MSTCVMCGQPYTNLRNSVKCDRCHRTVCSSCCRSSQADAKHHFCIACIRQQKKAEDPNDDRPKWLREAQQLHRGAANAANPSVHGGQMSQTAAVGQSSNKTRSDRSQTAVDDRPKWLREAQEREAAAANQKPDAKTDDIRDRLVKLKEEMAVVKPVLSEEAIRGKLAQLRDQDPSTARTSGQPDYSVLRFPEEKTESEEIESLIAQMKERAKLEDDDVDLIKELEARLQRLKSETAALGISTSGTSSPMPKPDRTKVSRKLTEKDGGMDVDSSDEEAEQIERILSKKLPDTPLDVDSYEDSFCIICPEDPVVVCLDCDKDMYCMRCFRECHKEWDAMDHRTKRIPKPRR
ncbi:abscission/NoCut checkpoint regulator-like [Paramacrobiotus metropolitanus]|uniref:abscission/NoCut checkpoint regulator-like n=1 Tax=Paramacrobiotus metropolitanus TaxID=2943436 RepID=UPI002445A265|nr:abscission/NoCut checkpoint regulator-like [Paramacrobiotus metropolitanus]XP_055343389.1 abscission/NoCut checkpoint regulator-like [Paramacrobiotus metropolitanus]